MFLALYFCVFFIYLHIFIFYTKEHCSVVLTSIVFTLAVKLTDMVSLVPDCLDIINGYPSQY